MIRYSSEERLSPREYVAFVGRTDLAGEYPRHQFARRITTLLERAGVCITARDEGGRLVGVALGITDFAYFLFLTDLAVEPAFKRRGIGSALVRRAEAVAGGGAELCTVTWSSEEAMPFYARHGWLPRKRLVGRTPASWEYFTVRDPDDALRPE